MHTLAVGVLGASGYVGRELCALVSQHPALELAFAAANERRGESVRIAGRQITFAAADDVALERAELVFCALPHGASAAWVARAREAGAKVVDLSADLRPGNETWQSHVLPTPTAARVATADNGQSGRPRVASTLSRIPHAAPLELPNNTMSVITAETTPYGLTELMRESVRGAELVANPGCYPTAILLALAPLLKRGLVGRGATINISAASGTTGAGFTPRADLLFAEVAEDFRPYAAGNTHRHLGEMREVVQRLGGDCDLLFTPHLLPVSRGILATITVPIAEHLVDPLTPWREQYDGEPFIEITSEMPALRDVVRRNVARISAVHADGIRRPTLIVVAAIDNLVKGAAGQAIQNANLMLGLDETLGLPA